MREIFEAINWTPLFLAVLGVLTTVLVVIIKRTMRDYVNPWLEQHQLRETAFIVVNAVEAILGRHLGEDKWKLALEKMQEAGWNIDDTSVLDALKAAWKELDLAMRTAGEKEPTPVE